MGFGVTGPRKDKERDGEDDSANHHHRKTVFGIGVAFEDLALVVALLNRAQDCPGDADSYENAEESKSGLSRVETVALLEYDGAVRERPVRFENHDRRSGTEKSVVRL